MITILINLFKYLNYIFWGDYEIKVIERTNSNETFIIYLSDNENI